MTRPFRFALQSTKLADPAQVVKTARRAEELGYSELYSADHFGNVDPFAPLILAASATSTLRVGPLVLNNEFHHPALLARTAASVDALTGGRLTLGLGTGYMQSEHDAIGLEIRPPNKRVTRFGESLHVLRSLLDSGSCTFDGVHHQVDIDKLGVTPRQARVPFLVGGHGKRVVRLAAKYADIYQFTGLTHGEGGALSAGGFRLGDLLERNDWLERAAGDRLVDIERSALTQHTSISSTAKSERPALAKRFSITEDEVDECPFILAGSHSQVVDKIGRLRDRLGISHFVVRDLDGFAPIVSELTGT